MEADVVVVKEVFLVSLVDGVWQRIATLLP